MVAIKRWLTFSSIFSELQRCVPAWFPSSQRATTPTSVTVPPWPWASPVPAQDFARQSPCWSPCSCSTPSTSCARAPSSLRPWSSFSRPSRLAPRSRSSGSLTHRSSATSTRMLWLSSEPSLPKVINYICDLNFFIYKKVVIDLDILNHLVKLEKSVKIGALNVPHTLNLVSKTMECIWQFGVKLSVPFDIFMGRG